MSTEPNPAPDTRNVVDFYKYWTNEAILADLDTKRNNFSVLCTNIQGDFNVSCIIRSANAFLAKEVIIYGKKKYDRRGTVGTHNYTRFKHVRVDEDLDKIFSEFDVIVGIDNVENSKPINSYPWDKNKKTLICFGEEQSGIPADVLKRCNDILYIKQYGSVRSLNCASAAAITLYDYCSKAVG